MNRYTVEIKNFIEENYLDMTNAELCVEIYREFGVLKREFEINVIKNKAGIKKARRGRMRVKMSKVVEFKYKDKSYQIFIFTIGSRFVGVMTGKPYYVVVSRGYDKLVGKIRKYMAEILKDERWEAVCDVRARGLSRKQVQEILGVNEANASRIINNINYHDPDYVPPRAQRDGAATAREIRRLYAAGATPKELTAKFGFNVSNILYNVNNYDPTYTPPGVRETRLSAELIREIRSLYLGGYSQAELEKKYQIKLRRILNGTTYIDEGYDPSWVTPYRGKQ